MKNAKNLEKGIGNNKNSGITLIALVISIIVLLILARHLGEYAKSVIIPY